MEGKEWKNEFFLIRILIKRYRQITILFCLDLSLIQLHISKHFPRVFIKRILSFLTPCDHGKFFQFACPSQSNCLPGPSLVGHLVLSKTPINIFGPCQMVLDTYLVLSKTITLKTHSQVQTAHNVCFYFWFTGLKHKEYCHVLLVQ